MDDALFNLSGSAMDACVMEIPQLWNERTSTKILVKDGAIVEAGEKTHGVYGGVQFGLDRFTLGRQRAMPAASLSGMAMRPSAAVSAMRMPGAVPSRIAPSMLRMGARPSAAVSAMHMQAAVPSRIAPSMLRMGAGPSAAVSAMRMQAAVPSRIAPSMLRMGARPQGVDLNLDDFELANPENNWEGNVKSSEGLATIGSA